MVKIQIRIWCNIRILCLQMSINKPIRKMVDSRMRIYSYPVAVRLHKVALLAYDASCLLFPLCFTFMFICFVFVSFFGDLYSSILLCIAFYMYLFSMLYVWFLFLFSFFICLLVGNTIYIKIIIFFSVILGIWYTKLKIISDLIKNEITK